MKKLIIITLILVLGISACSFKHPAVKKIERVMDKEGLNLDVQVDEHIIEDVNTIPFPSKMHYIRGFAHDKDNGGMTYMHWMVQEFNSDFYRLIDGKAINMSDVVKGKHRYK